MWHNIPHGWADMDDDERKNAAYAKGQKDYASCDGQADDPLTEMLHPNYDAPDGYEEEYADGWSNARNQ
jgi:hypothetical protein